MQYEAHHALRGGTATQPDIQSIANPLDFIAEVHMCEREVCALIGTMEAGASPDPKMCEHVLSFLKHQLPPHLVDEETDLFPAMVQRCDPEDEIQKVIDKLESDHRYALSDTPDIIAILEDKEMLGKGLSEAAHAQMVAFSTHARRHLILENAVVVPIARARLTPDDLTNMRHRMLERRGLALVSEAPRC